MSKDLYFNNDNIPPGEQDPGLESSRSGKDFNKKQTLEERQAEHDAWRDNPELKEHYE